MSPKGEFIPFSLFGAAKSIRFAYSLDFAYPSVSGSLVQCIAIHSSSDFIRSYIMVKNKVKPSHFPKSPYLGGCKGFRLLAAHITPICQHPGGQAGKTCLRDEFVLPSAFWPFLRQCQKGQPCSTYHSYQAGFH